ncbi:MAG TPA: hypothetical protein V6D47_10585, partial [Oscillatoriaceae cyanobacterium]
IVGACASLKLRLEDDALPQGWLSATGQGYFHTHRADGNVLYVASMAVVPEADREAVRRALDEALLEFARTEHATRVLVPVRLPEFVPEPEDAPAEPPLEQLAQDPVLQDLQGAGFRFVGLLPDHQDNPRANGRQAALLEWRGGAA